MDNEIKPPKSGISDDLYTFFFATLSSTPCVGPFIAEALKRWWPSRFEKAHAQWRADMTAQVNHTAQAFYEHQAIEEGLNANGSYRRIGDGAQEIEARVEIAHEYGDSITVVFSAAFAKPPIIQTFDESHTIKVVRVTPHLANFKLVDRAYRETITFRYRAIGRWR